MDTHRDPDERNWLRSFSDEVHRLSVGGGFPPINISVTEDELLVRAELPGINQSALDLTIAEKSLTIKGKRFIDFPESARLHHREREDGVFSRTITLPSGLDTSKADGTYANGILTISLPRSKDAQAKQIEVKGGK
jgi:HSP20 family protein